MRPSRRLRQEKDGRAAAYPDVITVASHTKKDNPAGLPSKSSSPATAPGHRYVLTRNAGGHQASRPTHGRLPSPGSPGVFPDPQPGSSQLYRFGAVFTYGTQLTDIQSFVDMGALMVDDASQRTWWRAVRVRAQL